jgi:hypothetical protein
MGEVHRLSRAIYKATTYLFNYTGERLSPGDLIAFDSNGGLHAVGSVVERLPEAEQARATTSVTGPVVAYTESQTIQRGLQVAVEMDAEATGQVAVGVNGTAGGSIAFGIGGGCFLDVTAQATRSTLGKDRTWLLARAASVMRPGELLVEETVSSAYVAAATSGWTSKLGLSVSADIDPAQVGIAGLAELRAKGKINLTVKAGSVFLKQPDQGQPLFRAVALDELVDLTSLPAPALEELKSMSPAAPMRAIHAHPKLPKIRVLKEVTPDDLRDFYAIDED